MSDDAKQIDDELQACIDSPVASHIRARSEFAKAAMQAYRTNEMGMKETPQDVARLAVADADALIAELRKGGGTL